MNYFSIEDNKSWKSLRKCLNFNQSSNVLREVLQIGEHAFVRKYAENYLQHEYQTADQKTTEEKDETFLNGEALENELRSFHRSVRVAADKANHLFFSLYNLSAAEMPEKAGILENIFTQEKTPFFEDVTSYSEIFNNVTMTDNGLDLFSPAAYFADLLRIIETYISSSFNIPEDHLFKTRRADLYSLPLTKEDSEHIFSYTKIILERLCETLQRIAPKTFGEKSSSDKKIDDEKIKTYCASNVFPVPLPFSMPHESVSAALTKNEFNPAKLLLTMKNISLTDSNEFLAAALKIDADYLKKLKKCDKEFYPDLYELKNVSTVDTELFSQTTGLSVKEIELLCGRGITNAEKFSLSAPHFYINQGLDHCIELSEDAKNIIGITKESLANITRFIRFASLTKLSFDQLDAIIQNGDIISALFRFAFISNTQKNEELLPLISSLYDYGSENTFQSVYGNGLALNNTYKFASILSALSSALGLSENDLTALYTFLFDITELFGEMQFNALYRNSYMAKLLNIGINEYIELTKTANIAAKDLCTVFSTEMISALLSYKDLLGFTTYEINYICEGRKSVFAGLNIEQKVFEQFLHDIKTQVDIFPDDADDKKNTAVEQNLINFLNINPVQAENLFCLIPKVFEKFKTWQEIFYDDKNFKLAQNIISRLVRAKLLLSKIPIDIFSFFAHELFTDNFDHAISYDQIANLCKAAAFYRANPLLFMCIADAFIKKDKKLLASLCAITEHEVGLLLEPFTFTLKNILSFIRRLDAVKSIGLSVTNLLTYLDILTKEDGYEDLRKIADTLLVPKGSKSAYSKALVSLCIQELKEKHPDISSPKNLSAYLLLDVETNEDVEVSYIREGINAALNYFNRCRSGLEAHVGRIEDISEGYWQSIMNFSEWKANRMVFVMPENYLLPDIRSSQSSLFKNALQGAAGKPLDAASAHLVYAGYLDNYAKLSTIIPCASYLSSRKDTEELYLFGKAKMSDAESASGFYYCIRKDGIWNEWTGISAAIPHTEITPIFIFGRLYIFWIERSLVNTPEFSGITVKSNSEESVTVPIQNTIAVTKFSIKYTCQSFSGTWDAVQTLFDNEYILKDPNTDYGKHFKSAYDTDDEGFNRLAAFRITERNFCDASGKFYIDEKSSFEKLLIMYGGFVYNFPNENIENYFPLKNSFDTQEKTAFSNKHADLCEKIDIMSQQNISGRLCSGSVRIFGSAMREEHIAANGEFFIFDEYTGGAESAAAAVTVDESSSIISSMLTADVLKNTLLPADKIIPKFTGKTLPHYGHDKNFHGEFYDTLHTFALGNQPEEKLNAFQKYLKSVSIANFANDFVTINPKELSTTTFYAPTSSPGILPAHFSDLYSILLQSLGSKNLFGTAENCLASDSEIIRTANLAGGFILKTGGMGSEIFLITPVPEKESSTKAAQLIPTDSTIVISLPKISLQDIKISLDGLAKDKEGGIFDVFRNKDFAIIDDDGYVYEENVNDENIKSALSKMFTGDTLDKIKGKILHLLKDRRLASSNMFWSSDIDKASSINIFNALTDQKSTKNIMVLPVDTSAAMQSNPKVKLRDTNIIENKTPARVSSIFDTFINAPLPISLRFRRKTKISFNIDDIRFDVTRLSNSALPFILPSFSAGGVKTFLKLENQQAPVPSVFPISRFSPNVKALNLPLALDGAQPDFDGLYKNYNYELFYHIPMYSAKTLRSFGNYADAKKWLEYIYSPLVSEFFITAKSFSTIAAYHIQDCINILNEVKLIEKVVEDSYRVRYAFCYSDFVKSGAEVKLKAKQFSQDEINTIIAILSNYTLGSKYGYAWQFFPFRSRTIEDLTKSLSDSTELRNYHNNPFDPHAIASLRIGAYEKYTVLEYADLLTEWGDREFVKLTWDSLTNALNLYNMANDILGKKPVVLNGRMSKENASSFNDLYTDKKNNKLSVSEKLFETLCFLLLDERDGKKSQNTQSIPQNEFFFPYFKIPVNNAALTKWDTVADRLTKIQNNFDINGNKRSIPLFPPATDPLELALTRNAAYASSSVSKPLITNNWYRYSVLYAYAKDFCATMIQFSAQLLSAIEKGDNETLQVLATKQNCELIANTKVLRKHTIKELEHEESALKEAKLMAEKRRDHYQNLINTNISKDEKDAVEYNDTIKGLNATAAATSYAAGITSLLPEVGSPFAMVYGGRELSSSLMNLSMGFMFTASVESTKANKTATYAGYARRKEEWEFLLEQAKSDIIFTKAQISANKEKQESAKIEQKTSDLIFEQTRTLIDFYQTKFSSYNLYSALSSVLRQTVFNSYKTAIELASRAEAAWQEETDDKTQFLTYTYWDDAKCGLLSGESLLSALDTMQASFIAKNPRRFEITKIISLADTCPDDFADLQKNGSCTFTLPLSLFDDEKAPMHKLHKIRTLSLSTQVIIGAYQNINAKLTQSGSVILADPTNKNAVTFVKNFGNGSATVPQGVISNRRSGQAITISHAQNESGMHFYDPSSGAYLPFEGTGAVSQWCLEFNEKNPFETKDISDIILNIAYTALPSSQV
jgi:hypothetical protein